MNPDESESPAPSGLGRTFELHECLGRGGFGEVYRATMVSPSGVRKVVAVKVLRKGLDPFSQSVERLRDEAHLLSALDHPAILKVHDLVILDGRIGLVTEYVDGVDLSTLYKSGRDLSPRMLGEAIADIASGLDAAWSSDGHDGHPMRLVHRDIKPANIRISKHGQVKLLDFGIARANIEREASTTTDTLIGTYQYMAPERFGNITGPEGDVFALGCVLFEGLKGERMLAGLTLQQHYVAVASSENYNPLLQAQIDALPDHVPASMRELLSMVLAYDRNVRPTAAELGTVLEREAALLRGLSIRAWCREHAFGAPNSEGELSGRRLREGAALPAPAPEIGPPDLVEDRRKNPPPRASGRSMLEDPPSVETVNVPSSAATRRSTAPTTPWWVWLLLLLSLGAIGAGLFSMFAGVLVGQSLINAPATQQPVPKPSVEPQPTAEPAPQPSTDPAPPEPNPVPAPVGTDPVPVADAPEPQPPVPEPEVEPVPEPEVEPSSDPVEASVATDGLVKVESPVPVRLVDSTGLSRVPKNTLPLGRYVIEADFGNGYERAGTGEVQPSRLNRVTCKRLLRTCAIE